MTSIDLTGKVFGDVTVIRFYSTVNKRRRWWCQCKCGVELDILQGSLTRGSTVSCGCRLKIVGHKNSNWNGCGELTGSQWSLIINNARNREIPVNITIQDAWNLFLKQNRKCALTGIDLTFSPSYNRDLKFSKREATTASLDRIDSSKGYEKGNIQWVHKDINLMKRTLSESSFISLCRAVVEYKR